MVEATAAYPTWLQRADLAALANYCMAWAMWSAAAQDVAVRGALVPARSSADTARGAKVKNPSLQVMRDASVQLRAWAKELGFTPDSRGRVDLGEVEGDKDDANPFAGDRVNV